RRRERAAGIGDGDAGAGRAVVEGEHLHESRAARNPRAAASSSSMRAGSLPPARAMVGRPPPPPPTIGEISRITAAASPPFSTASGVADATKRARPPPLEARTPSDL